MKPIYILTRRDGTVQYRFNTKQELLNHMSITSVCLNTWAIYEAYEIVPNVKVTLERVNDTDKTIIIKKAV